MLEAMEHSLELERLETREHLVALAEDDVTAREARVQEEVDRRVAEARSNLEREYEGRLELIGAEAEGRIAALRTRLTEVTQRADASAVALGAAHVELASSRAELLLLQQRVDGAEAVARRNEDKIRQRQTLEHMHSPMFRELRERANTAFGIICEAAVGESRVVNYAGNLQFFTDVVTQL